jgi:hypothetical protein
MIQFRFILEVLSGAWCPFNGPPADILRSGRPRGLLDVAFFTFPGRGGRAGEGKRRRRR